MRNIKFPVSEKEYLEILRKKGESTHKRIYMDALGITYIEPKTGRPNANLRKLLEKRANDRTRLIGKKNWQKAQDALNAEKEGSSH
jgi:CRISPR/Cas system CSM-associated protein Csm2 small subunit